MFSRITPRLPQWLSTCPTLYGPNKVRYSTGLVVNRWLLMLYCLLVHRHGLGWIMFFLQRGLRADVDCCFLGGREAPRCSWGKIYASSSCRNADSQGKQKSFCAASAIDELTYSWPHYCHFTFVHGCGCPLSTCTGKAFWECNGRSCFFLVWKT